MTEFERVYSGAPWEKHVGYCRALKVGSQVFVTGTAPVEPDGTVHAPGDGYRQTLRCLEIIRTALAELGVGMDRITRTRMFVTDVDRWKEFGKYENLDFFPSPPGPRGGKCLRIYELETKAVAQKPCGAGARCYFRRRAASDRPA